MNKMELRINNPEAESEFRAHQYGIMGIMECPKFSNTCTGTVDIKEDGFLEATVSEQCASSDASQLMNYQGGQR